MTEPGAPDPSQPAEGQQQPPIYGAPNPNQPSQPPPYSSPYGQPSQPPYGQPPQQPEYAQPANPPYGGGYAGTPPPQQPPYGQQYGQQYGQPYGQPYSSSPYGGYPMQASTNGFAIAAIICAFFCCPLGVIFGFISRSQIKRTGQSGGGLALAGIIVGGIFSLLLILGIAAAVSTGNCSTQHYSYGFQTNCT